MSEITETKEEQDPLVPFLLAGRKAYKALTGLDYDRKVRFNFTDEQIKALEGISVIQANLNFPLDEVRLFLGDRPVMKWKGIH